MSKGSIPFLAVCLLLVPFANQSQAQNTKLRKHAMPIPGMQMGHENRTTAADLRTRLVKAWNATDPASLASLFSESPVIILPTEKLVTGRQSILEFFQQKVTNTGVTLASLGFETSPELQVDFDIFSESNASASGANRDSNLRQNGNVEGKSLMVAKHVDAEWKIQEFIFVIPTQNF